MCRIRTLLIPALLLPSLFLPLAADDAGTKKAHDEEVRAALDAFKKAFKGGDLEKAQAVRLLEKVRDRKIVSQLGAVLSDPGVETRKAAAETLAGYEKDRDAASVLAKALPAAKKEPQMQIAYLNALGAIRDWSATPAVIGQFDNPDLEVSRAAMRAAADLRDPAAIPELIDFTGDRTGGPAAARADSFGDLRARRAQVKIAAGLALRRLTGESFREGQQWEDWWKAEGARVTAELQRDEKAEQERVAKEKLR
jgi:HEAT repeat protein